MCLSSVKIAACMEIERETRCLEMTCPWATSGRKKLGFTSERLCVPGWINKPAQEASAAPAVDEISLLSSFCLHLLKSYFTCFRLWLILFFWVLMFFSLSDAVTMACLVNIRVEVLLTLATIFSGPLVGGRRQAGLTGLGHLRSSLVMSLFWAKLSARNGDDCRVRSAPADRCSLSVQWKTIWCFCPEPGFVAH